MNIPRHWHRETEEVTTQSKSYFQLSAWGWSDLGIEDAKKKALERLAKLRARVLGEKSLDRYGYGSGAMREEVLERICSPEGAEIACITRNASGALVLNSAHAMFIDIDFRPAGLMAALSGLIRKLLGYKVRANPGVNDLIRMAEEHGGLVLQVYRTCGGLRCLVLDRTFNPLDPGSTAVLDGFGSDPLYVRLCRAQACYRARLTPKPWRVGAGTPPYRWPWNSEIEEKSFKEWLGRYFEACSGSTACESLVQIGGGAVHPEAAVVLAVHDKYACLGGRLA